MAKPTFNLLTQPFIPCVRLDGTQCLLGIESVFNDAANLREIRHQSPLVTIAIHRLLLAILHRNFGPPDYAAWQQLWGAQAFRTADLERYFSAFRQRFDLFDAEYPFFQDLTLQGAEPEVATRMIKEQSMTFTDTLSNHRIPGRFSGVSFADAACHLIAEQSFAMSAGAGYVSAHHAYAAVFLVVGSSLFETLMLNLTLYNTERPIPAQNDAPVWESARPELQARPPRGYVESLTWLHRRILLIPDGDVVREIVYDRGPRCEHTATIADPMLAYRVLKDSGVRTYSLEEERALWRDIPVLLSATGVRTAVALQAPQILADLAALVASGTPGLPETRQFDLRAYGLKGDKATIRFWREVALPLPLAFLGDDSLTASLQMALDAAETGASCLYKAATRLAADILSPGDKKPDESRVSGLRKNLGMERAYWGALERPFRRLIQDLSAAKADVDSLIAAWVNGVVRTEILRAFDGSAAQLDGRARSLRAIAQSSQLLRRMLAAKLALFGKGSEHEQ